jgi:disulfide bond formation protein DsbB
MNTLSTLLDRYSLRIALVVAWVAMMGSLYFSEVRHYIPCQLCWYQRIIMYPLSGIIAFGLLRKDTNTPHLVLPFSVLGMGVSTYHYLLQKTTLFSSVSTCQVGVPCSSMWINWFGFVTIPLLSLTAFTVITAMCLVALFAAEPVIDPEKRAPWISVVGLIGAVLIVFSGLWGTGAENVLTDVPPAQSSASGIQTGQSLAIAYDGASLYRQACGGCHGMQAEGVTGLGSVLTQNQFIQEKNDDELLAFIEVGRGLDDPLNTTKLIMPAWGGRPDLNPEQFKAIIAYLRTLQ